MHLKLTLRQLRRSFLRTALYGLIMLFLTAFFCVSLNLYADSQKNLQAANEAFTTIAVMELYADVDQYGNVLPVLDLETFQGHLATRVNGYDLPPIVNAVGVQGYDLRARYAAYIPGERAFTNPFAGKNNKSLSYRYDVIRFTVAGDESLALPLDGRTTITTESIELLESATDTVLTDTLTVRGSAATEAEMRFLEEAGIDISGCYTLEPGVEYIATVYYGEGVSYSSDKRFTRNQFMFGNHNYEADRSLVYYENGEEYFSIAPSADAPFWCYKYEDVQTDDRLREYFENVWEACAISACSYAAMTTSDVMGIPLFHLGNAYILDGRMITDAEYTSGAKVCLISAEQADKQGWNVGDTFSMSFYKDDFMANDTEFNLGIRPTYTKYTKGFFDSGEYEIVGIYDIQGEVGDSTLSQGALDLPWNMLILPEASVQNGVPMEDRPVYAPVLTLRMKNGSTGDFLAEMEALGVTEPKQGGYDANFVFYDQGYSRVVPTLETLDGTARLLLTLSGSLLIIAALLLGFFYAAGQRKNIGVMRLLGCTPARTFIGSLWGALFSAGIGSAIGAFIGHQLAAGVGASVLENAVQQNAIEYPAFSAFLAAGQQTELEFTAQVDMRLALLALGIGLGLFLISAAVFTTHSIARPPRALLAQDQR